jgi:hypothetical protein
MLTLYRILLRVAVAWAAIVGLIILIAGMAFHSNPLELVEMLGLVALGPAALAIVLAWIIKPVQWTQE